MKYLFLVLTLTLALNFSANAQAQIVKQRAKGVANTPQPANPAAAVGVPRPAPMATPPNAQQQHIAKLKADLIAIHSAGTVTDQAKLTFARDLLTVAQGAHHPSTNSVAALANSLLPALADRKVPVSVNDRMVQKLVVLMNSHGLSSTRAQEIAGEARTALTSSGVSTEAAAQIASDLQTIAAEIQKPAGL